MLNYSFSCYVDKKRCMSTATVKKRLEDFPNDSLTQNSSGYCYCKACDHRFGTCDLTTVRRHCVESASHKANLAKWKEQQKGAVIRSGPRTLRGFTILLFSYFLSFWQYKRQVLKLK